MFIYLLYILYLIVIYYNYIFHLKFKRERPAQQVRITE